MRLFIKYIFIYVVILITKSNNTITKKEIKKETKKKRIYDVFIYNIII